MAHEIETNAPGLGTKPARRRSPRWLRLGVALAGVGLLGGTLARGVDKVREAQARSH